MKGVEQCNCGTAAMKDVSCETGSLEKSLTYAEFSEYFREEVSDQLLATSWKM